MFLALDMLRTVIGILRTVNVDDIPGSNGPHPSGNKVPSIWKFYGQTKRTSKLYLPEAFITRVSYHQPSGFSNDFQGSTSTEIEVSIME
ncbi:hypothetical protein BGAL_1025g00020 [Botrytis galanthina]|uniref:Uncharacterized protein n=1 Tax=Botrytis galanthina TaxID=278940 RepID=A0A4S8QGV9_9HELO|nr:hypothetical protein BGAL_1025g00020 [Botrytis galanthina]